MRSRLSYFNSRYIPEPNSGCWLWTGYADKDGYGIYCTGSRQAKTRKYIKAHRLSYELFCAPVPEGKIVCHKCDNPSCVNPEHLFVGTWQDNVSDMVAKGRYRSGGKPHPGEENGRAKLSTEDVHFIRKAHCFGVRGQPGSTKNLAERFGVTKTVIQRIVRKESWSHI
jgi:hypothetical protein